MDCYLCNELNMETTMKSPNEYVDYSLIRNEETEKYFTGIYLVKDNIGWFIDTQNSSKYPKAYINYCPICGRKL